MLEGNEVEFCALDPDAEIPFATGIFLIGFNQVSPFS